MLGMQHFMPIRVRTREGGLEKTEYPTSNAPDIEAIEPELRALAKIQRAQFDSSADDVSDLYD